MSQIKEIFNSTVPMKMNILACAGIGLLGIAGSFYLAAKGDIAEGVGILPSAGLLAISLRRLQKLKSKTPT
jgi:CobQ-like glutamine amidotransferase family enzyme